MTENEIIKALECCGFDEDMCLDCPIQCDCENHTLEIAEKKDAILDFINRLQKENKELHNAFYNEDRIKVVQAKAIKEFVEKMIYAIVNTPSEKVPDGVFYMNGRVDRQNEIIDIIKRLVSDDEASTEDAPDDSFLYNRFIRTE